MASDIRVKKDSELTELERTVFNEAVTIAHESSKVSEERIIGYLSSVIKEQGEISQVMANSFINQIMCVFVCDHIFGIKRLADSNGDNEVTIQNSFENFCEGLRHMLKLPKKESVKPIDPNAPRRIYE